MAALASNDPTFIDKPWHPGRRLLNEIIGAATDYLDPDGGGDTELFRQAAAAIAALGRPDAGPQGLARLLAGFMAVVERERERADKLAERALQEAAARSGPTWRTAAWPRCWVRAWVGAFGRWRC